MLFSAVIHFQTYVKRSQRAKELFKSTFTQSKMTIDNHNYGHLHTIYDWKRQFNKRKKKINKKVRFHFHVSPQYKMWMNAFEIEHISMRYLHILKWNLILNRKFFNVHCIALPPKHALSFAFAIYSSCSSSSYAKRRAICNSNDTIHAIDVLKRSNAQHSLATVLLCNRCQDAQHICIASL